MENLFKTDRSHVDLLAEYVTTFCSKLGDVFVKVWAACPAKAHLSRILDIYVLDWPDASFAPFCRTC